MVHAELFLRYAATAKQPDAPQDSKLPHVRSPVSAAPNTTDTSPGLPLNRSFLISRNPLAVKGRSPPRRLLVDSEIGKRVSPATILVEQLSTASRIPRTAVVYHAIAPSEVGTTADDLVVDRATFEQEMAYLAGRRQVLSLSDLVDSSVNGGKPAVAITFDDGFRSVLTDAVPILERYGFTATVFVSTRWLDDAGETADTDGIYELLGPSDVKELCERGFEIGSHGHTHVDLGRLSATVVETELRASYERLRELLGKPPRFLAWPYGSSSEESEAAALAAGFEAAFAFNTPTAGRYSIGRVPIYRLDGRALFALKTSGRYFPVRRSPIVESAYSLLRPLIARGGPRSAPRRTT
jgi:peptidoglycan/xylan/chitin deacetylase (PgdA/CDA1 family)